MRGEAERTADSLLQDGNPCAMMKAEGGYPLIAAKIKEANQNEKEDTQLSAQHRHVPDAATTRNPGTGCLLW